MKQKQVDLELVSRLFEEWEKQFINCLSELPKRHSEFNGSFVSFLAGFKAGVEHGAGGSKTA